MALFNPPGRPEEDPSDEFRLGGWVNPYADEAIGQTCRTCSRSHSRFCWGAAPMKYSRRIGRAYRSIHTTARAARLVGER